MQTLTAHAPTRVGTSGAGTSIGISINGTISLILGFVKKIKSGSNACLLKLPKIATWFLNYFDLPTFQHNRNYPIDCVGANEVYTVEIFLCDKLFDKLIHFIDSINIFRLCYYQKVDMINQVLRN